MKKQMLLTIAIAVSAIAMAQSPSFGIRGGLSVAGLRGDAMNNLNDLFDFTDGVITTGNRRGFFGGAYVSLPLSEKITIEPALYYTQKGYAVKGGLAMKAVEFLGVNASAELDMRYLDLPVLVKANLNGFQLFAGPQVSYLTQAGLKTKAGILGVNLLNKNLDVADQFNRWDAGVTGGIGYQFANGMNITAAYDHGLSKVDANKNLNSYNHALKLGLGFRF